MSDIKVYDLTPFSMLDYPDRLSCIIWIAGCNLRCSYCYNGEIVFGKNKLDFDEVLTFLKKRINLLEAVVISGGEATTHPEILKILKKIKSLGYLIKLDTNGINFKIIKQIVELKLVDYIALDFKAPPDKFKSITASNSFENFLKTLNLIANSGIDYEIRTTVHSKLLNEDDINEIINILKDLNYDKIYYLQPFLNGVKTIGNIQEKSTKLNLSKLNSSIKIIYRA